jgi:hypothetical protein
MKTETPARCFQQFLWLGIVPLSLLVIQITGCADAKSRQPPASMPEGSAAMKQQALSFAPPPGKSGIYVIRPYHFYNDTYYGGSTVAFDISLDYQEFGLLETNYYLFGIVSSGKHVLGRVHFTTEAGSNYYFTATGEGIGAIRHLQIDPISETNGQAYVRILKLSGYNRFELQNQPGQPQ